MSDCRLLFAENEQLLVHLPVDVLYLPGVPCLDETVVHEFLNRRGHRVKHDCDVLEVAHEIRQGSLLAHHGDLHESFWIARTFEVQGLSCNLLESIVLAFREFADTDLIFDPDAGFAGPGFFLFFLLLKLFPF